MNKDTISKLVNCEYKSEDDILGKSYLLKNYPKIKEHLMDSPNRIKMIPKSVLERDYGIILEHKVLLAFSEEDFPELY